MKKKLEHIWFYYKWYLLAAVVVLILAVNFISAKLGNPEPDYYVAVVTGNYVSEETRSQLEEKLGQLWADTDGDGTVTVAVNFYQYDADAMNSTDTASFMVAAVQLAADFQEKISLCFFTDCPELLMENAELFSFGMVETSGLAGIGELEGFSVLAYEHSEQINALFTE